MAKIAINSIFYQPKGGGIAEYIYNLVSNLERVDHENEYVLYVLKDYYEYALKNLPPRFRIKVLPYGKSFMEVVKRSLFSQQFWYKEEAIERFDLFHSPFFHAPKFKHAKVVLTVHDMRFFRFPYTYTLPRYLFLRHAVKESCKRSDHIITISQFTKEELIEAYVLSEDKITVIHEAINKERFSRTFAESYCLSSELEYLKDCTYILSVGHVEPRKNYDRLIDAFCKVQSMLKLSDVKLVIVGKKGHHYKNTIKKMEKTDGVIYLNFVEHEFLQWLYQHAALFVFPSFYEGFGFPPLEAGCYGVVSAVSNVSSMPEVCGDAVTYFNPYDVDDMATVIYETLQDNELIKSKRSAMTRQIDSFSWKRNAKETLDVYQRVHRLKLDVLGGVECRDVDWLLAA